MLEAREVEIRAGDGQARIFRIEQLPATVSLKLLNRLGKVIGPALAAALEGSKEVASLGDIDLGALGLAVGTLFEKLTEAELDAICDVLFSKVELLSEDKRIPISWRKVDSVLHGDLPALFRLLGAALEVNYKGFFEGPLARARQALASRVSKSPGSSTSSGPSGGSSSSAAQP